MNDQKEQAFAALMQRMGTPGLRGEAHQIFTAGWDAALACWYPNKVVKDTVIESIYAAYPRKTDRQEALKSIRKAIVLLAERGQEDPANWLLGRVKTFAAAVATWSPEDRQYIKMPATWMNKGSYDDADSEWQRGKPAPVSQFSRSY